MFAWLALRWPPDKPFCEHLDLQHGYTDSSDAFMSRVGTTTPALLLNVRRFNPQAWAPLAR